MPKTAAVVEDRSREYETVYVLRPDVEQESAKTVATRIEDVVGRKGGKLTLVESWGRRRLAYPVRKHQRGVYVYLKYLGGGALVAELERQLSMLDGVLKFQTVKLRDDVDAASVDVKSDDVQFEFVEPQTEADVDESIERRLGLEEPAPVQAPPPDDAERPAEAADPLASGQQEDAATEAPATEEKPKDDAEPEEGES